MNNLPEISINQKELSAEQKAQYKTLYLRFAVLSILGIGGITAASIGIGGLLKIGALNNLGKVQTIVMLSIGGGLGIPFFIVGVVCLFNTRKKEIQDKQVIAQRITEHEAREQEKAQRAVEERAREEGVVKQQAKEAVKQREEAEQRERANQEQEQRVKEEGNAKQKAKIEAEEAKRRVDPAEQRAKIQERERAQNERFLPLFQQAVAYIQNPEALQALPRAKCGENKNSIYMPPELPVVIRVMDEKRFANTQQANALCKKHGLRYVQVPEIRQQGNFTIEDRLPNENAGCIEGMIFYYTHRQFYAPAVQEITFFLCHACMGDVIDGTSSILQQLGPMPRLDNLLLYGIEKEGRQVYKIGPIDFDFFYLRSSAPTKSDVIIALSTAIKLFPYHTEEIIAVGQKFFVITPEEVAQWHKDSQKSIQFYDIICENNLSFYQKHQITLENPFPPSFSLSPERKKELAEHISMLARKKHEENPFCRLKGDPDQTARRIQEEFAPQLLDFIEKWMLKMLANNRAKQTPIKNYGELIRKRFYTPSITNINLQFGKQLSGADRILIGEIFEEIFEEEDNELVPAYYYIVEIFHQLVQGGEIAYFDFQKDRSQSILFL